jgi:hypothetical protein
LSFSGPGGPLFLHDKEIEQVCMDRQQAQISIIAESMDFPVNALDQSVAFGTYSLPYHPR